MDTDQAALLIECKYPQKRASEHFLELQKAKLVEGVHERKFLAKVWRLTKKGREFLGIDGRGAPLTGSTVDHNLAFAEIYMHLSSIGTIKRWAIEPRYSFGDEKYAPDVFCCIEINKKTHFFFIESQLSKMASTPWALKWGKATLFFDSREFKTAEFQDFKKDGEPYVVPSGKFKIIVISSQLPETIRGGSSAPLIIVKDIRDLRL